MENPVHRESDLPRTLWFSLGFVFSLALFWRTIRALVELSVTDERYSYIVFIPLISIGIVFWKRFSFLQGAVYSPKFGLPILAVGLILYAISRYGFGGNLGTETLSVVVVWVSMFAVLFGLSCVRRAIFPLSFLFLVIPIPPFVLASIVSSLQEASATTTSALFHLLGVPVVRHGLRFSLPGVDIEIAEQCSGIRSTLSLFISGILASYLVLQSTWRRVLFSLITIPIAIFKNGLRIVTLSYLGVYVDQTFLHGKLHQYGGLPVSFIALAILAPIILTLRKSEMNPQGAGQVVSLVGHAPE